MLPLSVLYSTTVFSKSAGPASAQVFRLVLPSVRLAAAIAAAAVLFGYVPGRLLGTSRRGQGVLFLLFLMPLLLPRYMLYFAWALLLTPTNALGRYLSGSPETARFVASLTSSTVMVLWYWPLAALLIGQGWRALDKDAWESASLDAGPVQRFFRITLPMLAGPLAMAFGACFVLCLGEFGTFHLAGVRTVGTELAVLYQLTGSESAVARSAWPVGAVGLLVAVMLWRKSKRWAANPPTHRVEPALPRWGWAIAAALVGVSLIAPLVLLAANLDGLGAFGVFPKLQQDALAWSFATAGGAAVLAVLIAYGALSLGRLGRCGRLLSPVVHTTIFLAMLLPGSIVAVALLKTLTALGLPGGFRQGWYIVSAGQATRFAGVVLILLRLARDTQNKHLGEMASADGAGAIRTWVYVHLPRTWPVLAGAILLVVMFSMTEVSATMVLLPAGVPSFAQWMLNQMHYARDQHVIAACLVLVAAYVVLAGSVVMLLRIIRARRALALLLCVAVLGAAGCDSGPESSSGAEVLDAFGRTGSGRCEFIYPRAIALGQDGSLFVVDKTGTIRRFTREGDFVSMMKMPSTEAGMPVGLSVGPDGNLYVADTHYHRVVVFTPEGKLLRQFGRFGQGAGCLIYPTDVAFSDDGRIFVSEYGGNDRVSVFSLQGDFLYSFGTPGDARGQFARPAALCVDRRRKRLYVADACNHRIAVYTLDGRLERYIGSVGRNPGQLRYPYDLALTGDGVLVVCEYGNNRLQLFSPEGEPLGTHGRPGRRLGELACPWGVAVDERRRAYVVDSGNNRVQVWQL